MVAAFTSELDALFEGRTSAIARDLKLNLKKNVEGGALAEEEALLALLAVASALDLSKPAQLAARALEAAGVSPEGIREAGESAAIMGMLNTYYRFRHMSSHAEDFKIAGLRMTVFANPVLGKTRFEMLAFAVSVVNGCENCIRSHEEVLRQAGVPVEKIHDLVRIASIAKGLQALKIT